MKHDNWITNFLNTKVEGKMIPFVIGVNVGIAATTINFIVCYFLIGP